MYQGGTLDVGITPSLRRPGGVYDATPAPKYLVDFSRAGHFTWTDLRGAAHDEITEYAIAFLDHYVMSAPAAPVLTRATSGIAELRYDSELGRSPPGRVTRSGR